MPDNLVIAGNRIGSGSPMFVIGEIALAHDGSLGCAHAYIDAVADAGADAVKFQTHIAEAEGTAEEQFRVRVFPQDATRRAYWQRTSFSEGQWLELAEHARKRALVFMSTPFSLQAVELLERIGMPAWKIGSGETGNLPLLEHLSSLQKPVLLSTGMSPWAEIDAAVATLATKGCPHMVFQCRSAYPCPPEQIGLDMIARLRQRYGCPIGLSDHSGKPCTALAARTLGADALEVHVTFHRKAFGPDVAASVTVDELAGMVQDLRFIERALGSTTDKDACAVELAPLRQLFTKSVVAAKPLKAGAPLQESDLAFKKPGTGVPAARWREIIGRILIRDLLPDSHIDWNDLQ